MNPEKLPQGRLELPNGVTGIPANAFYNCTKLTSAVIPESVKEIGASAFASTGLTSVKLNEGLKTIKNNAFANTKLTEVEIPASVTSYYVPLSDSLSTNIFAGVPLKKITVGGESGITKIPQYMFQVSGTSDTGIEEIVLREGVKEIGNEAFYFYYPNLKKVTLPSSLTTIGSEAFRGATGLEKLISGPNLSSIGSNAFYNTHPTFYKLPGTERNEWLSDWCGTSGFTYDPDAAVTVTVRFDDGTGEVTVAADNTVEVEIFSLLTEPEPPTREGWSFLGWYAGDSQTPWIFTEDRVGAADLTLTAHWQKESANGLYRIEDGQATLLSYALAEGESTAVVIPPTWQGMPVTGIADGAFAGKRVTMVTIPASVTSIGTDAFRGAENLLWIDVQRGNSVFASHSGILYSADGTRLIFCPEGKHLQSFTVPENVTEIGPFAFAGHGALQELLFNGELTAIGEYAFSGCGLTALSLPDGLQSIGTGAFEHCYDLETVEGAAGCRRIGDNAFASTGFCIFYGTEDSALVRYAIANERPYNIFAVTVMLDDEPAGQYRMKAGESVPRPSVQVPEDRVIEDVWYTDEEGTASWNFDTDQMPMADLTLYVHSLPLFETEEYLPEAAEGEEAPAAGLRVTGYNGTGTEITLPQTIGGLAVYTANAEAFPEGSAVTLPGALLEINVSAFVQRNITLYAPVGSATEQLLLAAAGILHQGR